MPPKQAFTATEANAPGSDNIIRGYDHAKDQRIVKMLVGQGVMEGLAYANQRTYTQPITLLVWTALSLLFIAVTGLWPQEGNLMSWLRPITGFASVSLPLLGIVEFLHRPKFSARLRRVIGAPDMTAFDEYYGDEGAVIFEHKGEVGGVICLDRLRPGDDLTLETVLGEDEGQVKEKDEKATGTEKRQAGSRNATPKREGLRRRTRASGEAGKNETAHKGVAQIRHLDVDHLFRRADVATELTASALDHVFAIADLDGNPSAGPMAAGTGSAGRIEKVVVLTNPLTPGGEAVFRKCGFEAVGPKETEKWQQPEPLGLFGWKGRWLGVTRERWVEKREELAPRPE